MQTLDVVRKWLQRLLEPAAHETPDSDKPRVVARLREQYGLTIVEQDPKGNARPWRDAEIELIHETVGLLGPTFYSSFVTNPIHLWIDRNPGGGGYGSGWLRVGEPERDLSVLYRIFLHEATHASNELRGWIYERQYCMRPGLDWQDQNGTWRHPRQQGHPPQPGEWETLPVDSRDVSTAPGEDLAEMVRYYVHSVRDERQFLWPLDQGLPATYLWDTSPTRFVFVRDHFLQLASDHPWYRRLPDELEAQAAANLQA